MVFWSHSFLRFRKQLVLFSHAFWAIANFFYGCDSLLHMQVTLPQLSLLETALSSMPRIEVFVMRRQSRTPGDVFAVSEFTAVFYMSGSDISDMCFGKPFPGSAGKISRSSQVKTTLWTSETVRKPLKMTDMLNTKITAFCKVNPKARKIRLKTTPKSWILRNIKSMVHWQFGSLTPGWRETPSIEW